MRGLKIIGISIFLILAILAVTSCTANQSQSQQQVQVTKSDIIVKVNGSGKVVVETDAKPSFGNGGKITKLNIKEGDKVTKGMVLAQLETDNLALALSSALVSQAQAQVALTQSQSGLTQAQTTLAVAQFNLDRTQAVSEIKDAITNAEWTIKAAQVSLDQAKLSNDASGINNMTAYINSTQFALLTQQRKLQTLLNQPAYAGVDTYNILGQTYDRLTVDDVHLKQLAVESAQLSITQAQQTAEQAKRSLDQATKAIAVAQKQLNDATIISPINGTAVTVNVKEADVVPSASILPTTPIYIIDNSTIEVSAQIDEIDIAGVKLGQKVNISLDSAPNTQYEGKVNSIAMAPVVNPTNSGVVVYEVKIVFVNPPPPEVKLGMSSTVDIITNQKTGVLTIPNRAIKEDSQGKSTVSVMVNKKIETRSVQVGLTDGINTEITSGLNPGDTVVIAAAANSGLFGQ